MADHGARPVTGATAEPQEGESRIAGGPNRPIQKRKASAGWTKRRRETFLKVLAETCNVSMATRAAGAAGSPYRLRRIDPAFALLWDEALAIGYDRLETMLLHRALDGVNAIDVDALVEEVDREQAAADESGTAATTPAPLAAGISARSRGQALSGAGVMRNEVQLALALLNRRRDGEVRQKQKRQLLTSEEVDALLLKKLDSLARKLKSAP